jgi:sortase A
MYSCFIAQLRCLPSQQLIRWLQRIFCTAGMALLSFCVLAVTHAQVSSRLSLWVFDVLQQSSAGVGSPTALEGGDERIDFSLWSLRRIAAYKSSTARILERPIAILRIPRLGLIAPVFEGTDTLTLNRGLGRTRGTARFGESGNVGIAGHRDSFFRRLKDVGTGELIEVVTETEKNDYVVTRTTVVTPSDVGVLRTSSAMAITLVTCYPFYMVGDAPYRYVVQTSFITQVRKELNNAARHKGEQHMHRLKDFSLCRIGLAVTALGLTLVLRPHR